MLDQALAALKSFDWGTDPSVLQPIEDAAIKSHGDTAARGKLEQQLVESLQGGLGRAGKDYACRILMRIGSAACVPCLAGMLADEADAHLARFALERIPGSEAAAALRDALGKVSGSLQLGVISSLGARRDEESVEALSGLLSSSDVATVRAAAMALGAIRSAGAAKALAAAKITDAQGQQAVTDASLACAEGLLAAGKKVDALAVYKRFADATFPKHVRLAATRGVLACARSNQ